MFERVALLESQGQAEASQYPLWYLGVETEVAVSRINAALRTEASLAASAYASIKSKKGAKLFKETLEKLQ